MNEIIELLDFYYDNPVAFFEDILDMQPDDNDIVTAY